MAVINVLNEHISNMIAAGEVLERPASAVKELIENSIDAGADRIVVEIEDGGKSLIKISDNGCGMSKTDAKNCFLRHATSKIKNEKDLDAINTLGFRGEALASIAAVSEVTLITRTKDELAGTKVVIRAGKIIEQCEIGCNIGTVITVKDLFFNTPARMKFLKTDATEGAYISEIIEKMIIINPHISFLFIKNGRESLYSAGDNNELSNLLNIYKNEIYDNLVKVSYEKSGISVTGYIGNEKILKNNRKSQIFFVNNRVVRNRVFFSAVDEAVKERVTVSKYPFVILKININPELVDVNVHPTKAEVKFQNDRDVYNAIYEAIYNSYHVSGIDNKSENIINKPLFEEISFVETKEIPEKNTFKFRIDNKKIDNRKIENEVSYNSEFNELETVKFNALTPAFNEKTDEKIADNKHEHNTIKDYRIIGQIFDTFIVIEKDNKMYLLDQHAAHERLLYDKFLKSFKEKKIISQKLLVPFGINLRPVEMETLKENINLFIEMGFDISEFTDDEIIVREVPFDIDTSEISEIIQEIIKIIDDNKNSYITYKQEKSLHLMACKAAIKANMKFDIKESEALVYDVLNLQDANTCPHGRPLFVSFDRKTIEKQFKRS